MKSARFFALAVLVLCACGSKKPAETVGSTDDALAALAARKAAAANAGHVTGHLVASVGERSLGPFLARRGAGPHAAGLVAWVTQAEGSGRRVVVVPVDGRGQPRGPEKTIALVPIDTTMLVVRPMRGRQPGFVVAWTSLIDRGEALWAIAVGDDGVPRSKGVELAHTSDDVVWVDIVPTEFGAVCLWAEETRSGDANVVAASLNTDGKVRGVPTRVARSVVGWHALEIPNGVGVSTLAAPDGHGRPTKAPESRSGALSFVRIDPEAHLVGAPVVITPKPIVSGDLEVARAGTSGSLVFAWTDRSGDEPAVVGASIDEKNVVAPPRRIAEARGGAALLGLAGGAAGTAIMFEAPARRKSENRRVHVSRLAPTLALEGRPLSFEVIGRAMPELVATASGFAAAAPMHDCEFDSPTCPNAKVVATIVRTDVKGALVQREPLNFGSDPATLAWGLTCDGDTCVTLAASPGTPARIRAAEVRPRENAKPAAEPAVVPKDGPHVEDVTAIASGETVLDLAATRIGETNIVAMLSAKPDGGRGRGRHDHEVTLTTRVVDANGAASAPTVISPRALPAGSVAIAPAEKADDGGALAWIAREGGDQQVHVTRIDKRGKRTADVQLTTTKGDATDVTLTWAGGGWIVAWVDWRDGNGEVYATKVSLDLQRTAREERITNAPGDASDLVALGQGDIVWLAWADPRESPKDGMADVYATAVKMRDAKRAFDEHRLIASAAHSRTPQLAPAGTGVHVAWIEEAPLGIETPASSGYGALWVSLDEKGTPVAKPTKMPLAGDGAATSVTLETTPTGPRAIVARSSPDAVALDAIVLGGSSVRGYPLLTLDGPPSLDVALVLHDGVVYFNDEGPRTTDKRARRARIAWTSKKP